MTREILKHLKKKCSVATHCIVRKFSLETVTITLAMPQNIANEIITKRIELLSTMVNIRSN